MLGVLLGADFLRQLGDILDNAFDAGNHLADSSGEKNVSPLWKQYIRGHVACHCHLTTTVGGSSRSHDLCADFQVPSRPSEEELLDAGTLERSTLEPEHGGPNKD